MSPHRQAAPAAEQSSRGRSRRRRRGAPHQPAVGDDPGAQPGRHLQRQQVCPAGRGARPVRRAPARSRRCRRSTGAPARSCSQVDRAARRPSRSSTGESRLAPRVRSTVPGMLQPKPRTSARPPTGAVEQVAEPGDDPGHHDLGRTAADLLVDVERGDQHGAVEVAQPRAGSGCARPRRPGPRPASRSKTSVLGGRPPVETPAAPSRTSPSVRSASSRAATAVRDSPVTGPSSARVPAWPARIRSSTCPGEAGSERAGPTMVHGAIQPTIRRRSHRFRPLLTSPIPKLSCARCESLLPWCRSRAHVSGRTSMSTAIPVSPCDFVVFGGTGDLAMRKLLPALYLRDRDDQLTDDTRVVALSRAGLDDEGFRAKVRGELERFVAGPPTTTRPSTASWPGCSTSASTSWSRRTGRGSSTCSATRRTGCGSSTWPAPPPCSARSATASPRPGWSATAPASSSRSRSAPTCAAPARSTTPSAPSSARSRSSASTTTSARRASRTSSSPGSRTSSSSRSGTRTGSTTSRSPSPSRSASASRGGYYDGSGALRDMVQNHLLQLLCLVAMEPPTYVNREDVRDEKLKVLRALRPITGTEVAARSWPASTAPAWSTARRRRRTPRGGRPRAAAPRPSSRSRRTSTTGAGPESRSTSAPASGWTTGARRS